MVFALRAKLSSVGSIGSLHFHIPPPSNFLRIKDGAALHDLLEHVMFFGASLGRLGADFRPLVVPVFEEAIAALVLGRWASAEADFAAALRANHELESFGVLPLYIPVSTIAAAAAADGSVGAAGTPRDGSEPPEPPQSILAFPALAHSVNQFLDSFNHLRQCASRSLRPVLEASFEGSLQRFACLLAKHTEDVAGNPDAAEEASLLWREAGEVALPHCCDSLAFLFGTGEMADRLKARLYEVFASQGLACARPKRPLPAASAVTEVVVSAMWLYSGNVTLTGQSRKLLASDFNVHASIDRPRPRPRRMPARIPIRSRATPADRAPLLTKMRMHRGKLLRATKTKPAQAMGPPPPTSVARTPAATAVLMKTMTSSMACESRGSGGGAGPWSLVLVLGFQFGFLFSFPLPPPEETMARVTVPPQLEW